MEKISCTDLVKNEEVLQESRRKRTSYIRQEKQYTYNVVLGRVRVTIFAVKKAIIITYSEHVSLAYIIQHAKRMRYIVNCGLSGCTVFPHYLITGTTLRSKLLNIKCVFCFLHKFFFLKRLHSEANSVR